MSPSKSFKDNPALNFISPQAPVPRPEQSSESGPAPTARPEKARPAAAPPEPEAPLKLNPLYVETKSRRVQLLMQPGLHRELKARAEARGQSFNDLVHGVLAEWTEKP